MEKSREKMSNIMVSWRSWPPDAVDQLKCPRMSCGQHPEKLSFFLQGPLLVSLCENLLGTMCMRIVPLQIYWSMPVVSAHSLQANSAKKPHVHCYVIGENGIDSTDTSSDRLSLTCVHS